MLLILSISREKFNRKVCRPGRAFRRFRTLSPRYPAAGVLSKSEKAVIMEASVLS